MYLATQMRQNASELRSASSDAAVRGIVEWLNPLIMTPESFDVFWRGVLGEELDETEAPRFIVMAFTWLKTVEAIQLKYEEGVIDPQVWDGWSVILQSFNRHRGIRNYWEQRRPAFSTSFARWMDEAPASEAAPLPNMQALSAVLSRAEATNT